MTISSGMETILVLLVGATAVFLMVRVAARRYRDKPQVWRSQAFLAGVSSSPRPEPESSRRDPSSLCAASRT